MKTIIILMSSLLLYSCATCEDGCDKYCVNYWPQTDYETTFNEITEKGVRVDRIGVEDPPALEEIDRIVDEVEESLIKNFPSGYMDDEQHRNSYCMARQPFPLPVDRKCIRIKIASDTLLSYDGTEQVLPWEAHPSLCEAKGLVVSAEYPCYWRAGIQDRQTAVATQSLHMLRDPLVRIITGCSAVWFNPLLAECATPNR